jgi:MFS transporter, DHA1 family, multidrug resistance protein
MAFGTEQLPGSRFWFEDLKLTFHRLKLQGGFAAQANGWRWPIYELLWVSGASLLLLAICLPETLGETILIRRAERLRSITGNPLIKTQAELDRKEDETFGSLLGENAFRAIQLSLEPAVLFANSYIALVYAM